MWYAVTQLVEALRYKPNLRVRIPIMPLEFFIGISFRTPVVLESTQPLTEMSIRNISWGVKLAARRAEILMYRRS